MINFHNVRFAYRGHKVFDDLTLSINGGGIYGLLGRNGAGKTTLLNLTSGLLRARHGTIDVAGDNPAARNPDMLSKIFMLPEEFELPRMNMEQYAKTFGAFYPKFDANELHYYLSQFNVEKTQNLHQMSFGQKKKAYIAFALACNTELLLMDEPTNGLDIPSKGEFRRLLSSICDDNRTIIISTHQVRDLEQLIDSVIILDGSEILLKATCAQITEKLLFTHITPEMPSPLYCEKSVHGVWGVVENVEKVDSPFDMELLFNAVIENPQKISKIFYRNEK